MSSTPSAGGTGRRCALGAAATVTALFAAIGVVLLPTGAVLGLAGLSLLVGGIVTAAPRLAGAPGHPEASTDLEPRRGARAGLGTFVGVMAMSGMFTVLGAAAGPVTLVICAGAGGWAWSARRRRLAPPETVATPTPLEPPTATAGVTEVVEGSDLSGLSDDALCLAWRRSFTAIGRAADLHQRGLLVDLRGRYLDEIERRHPRDFARWLADGPRAASDPARYVSAPPRPRPTPS